MSNIKRFKWLVSKTLVLVGRLRQKVQSPVLLYHSVDESGSVISVSRREFGRQMAYLKANGYQTISLQDYVYCLEKDIPTPRRTVVLTFDDGFENNYSNAFPILQYYGFTGTVFLATDFIGNKCNWQRDPSIGNLPMLNWSQIREMRDFGIEFGSHGCSHARLPKLGRSEMRRELTHSKRVLEKELESPARFFCHPYGDVSEATQQMVKEAGYAAAFGTLVYSSTNAKRDLYNLKRVGTARFSNLDDFKAGVLGTYDGYVHLKARLGI